PSGQTLAVTTTLSFITIGLDWFSSRSSLPSWPGNSAFHRTFLPALPPHSRGSCLSSVTPCPVGPRHEGQSPAEARQAQTKKTAMAESRFISVTFRFQGGRGAVAAHSRGWHSRPQVPRIGRVRPRGDVRIVRPALQRRSAPPWTTLA